MTVSNFKMPEDVNVLKENLGCADVSFFIVRIYTEASNVEQETP